MKTDYILFTSIAGLAAAFAGINRKELTQSLSLSPMSNNTSSVLYSGLHQAAAASALGINLPHFLAANRQAAAAFMASQMPMSSTIVKVASSLFPPHPALFNSWTSAHANSSGPHSPPVSPHSPITLNVANKHSLLVNSPKKSGSIISASNTGIPTKKARKIVVKKELGSPRIEISMSVNDLYNAIGPISPPSSGSSPNSNHEGQLVGKDVTRDKSFTCPICSRSFGYKHVLQNHERTHTGEKPFECPECHKRFTRDHHLKTHMRLHTGEKPYHCSHCDRQFVQVANLRRHLRVHTGERPYTCEICHNKFSDSNQLKTHMLVHNGEKPFECESCHGKFRRRHHLLNHKCGIPSPPTPAISPAISDHPLCEQNPSTCTYDGSDESIDLLKVEVPLDLSEDGVLGSSGNIDGYRNRKPHDIRRVFRLPPQIMHVVSEMPEQTEPEDLSVRSPRSNRDTLQSPLPTNNDDIDLYELDDAAALHAKQKLLLRI